MDTAKLFPWFILLNPLIAAVLILVATRKNHGVSATISTLSALFGLVAALCAWSLPEVHSAVQWIDFGKALQIPLGVKLDQLAKTMLLVVTGIGFLVHLYSTVYMEHDESKARFFGHLSLFMFSMLGIVLADNFAMMFIFWELVGVSSYLLIGHWFTRDAAGKAANKAFIMNRLGDFGFMLGILMLWATAGTVTFDGLEDQKAVLAQNPYFLGAAVLLVFCGAIGKSAQFPLHTWLPDAMEGPTPVSALIHAATMVAAGVYMLARLAFLIELSPVAGMVIAWVGAITSILAALMATQQDDIKRVLAYSTLSQLGYMVMAAGLAPDVEGGAAMFHLWTHAFFKALLFLGAGAVIHALHHEQDIWKMGGLSKTMRITTATFALGTLALTGCPGLAGFFSKDAILLSAFAHNKALFGIGLATAFLTAFYMTRLFAVAFLGKARSEAAHHGHDCPRRMTWPLVILAFLSIFAAYGAVPHWFGIEHGDAPKIVPTLAILAFLTGTGVAWMLYAGAEKEPLSLPLFRNKFYFDEIYGAIVAGTQDVLAFIAAGVDAIVLTVVRAVGGLTLGLGYALRLFQVGNVQAYAFIFGLGVVTLIYFLVFR
ncbi:NADH-quinone oxidoreductase subunit L [Verrucomicrobiota bacterium]|jgi:NADH-quinone oxidoreductase subunit L|nr:NADH-quinone oxidoreductase subunit L [Verrucomicrobiota bacterium]